MVPDSGGVHCGGQELPWSMAIPLINQQKKWAWRIALGEVVGVSCNTNAKEMSHKYSRYSADTRVCKIASGGVLMSIPLKLSDFTLGRDYPLTRF